MGALALAPPAGAASLQTWDKVINTPARFKVLPAFAGAAVLDKETGLVWQQAPSGSSPLSHGEAARACIAVRTGNRGGWRLPSGAELRSLFDETQPGGLPSGHPFTAPDVNYWSSTSLGTGACGSGVIHWSAPLPTIPTGSACDLPSVVLNYWCVRGSE
jgi:hypothetical protein